MKSLLTTTFYQHKYKEPCNYWWFDSREFKLDPILTKFHVSCKLCRSTLATRLGTLLLSPPNVEEKMTYFLPICCNVSMKKTIIPNATNNSPISMISCKHQIEAHHNTNKNVAQSFTLHKNREKKTKHKSKILKKRKQQNNKQQKKQNHRD